MNVAIINKDFSLNIYGLSGIASSKDYAGTAFKLMDKMWRIVKSNALKNKGFNIWVYEPNDSVFAGVELEGSPDSGIGLEQKRIVLKRYAYYKHVGPYNLLKTVGPCMKDEIKNKGFEADPPYIEIYGHWINDENKLETEVLINLK